MKQGTTICVHGTPTDQRCVQCYPALSPSSGAGEDDKYAAEMYAGFKEDRGPGDRYSGSQIHQDRYDNFLAGRASLRGEIDSLKQEVAGGSWAYVKQIEELQHKLEAAEKREAEMEKENQLLRGDVQGGEERLADYLQAFQDKRSLAIALLNERNAARALLTSTQGKLEKAVGALKATCSHSFYCIVEGNPTGKGECPACQALAEIEEVGEL